MAKIIKTPGVYIQEIPPDSRNITGVNTSVCAFIGTASQGEINKAVRVLSFTDFAVHFGGLSAGSEMSYAVNLFFLNGGREAWIVRIPAEDQESYSGSRESRTGIFALEPVDLFNILCLPGVSDPVIIRNATDYCRSRRAFIIIDAPKSSGSPAAMKTLMLDPAYPKNESAAIYYPWIRIADPLTAGAERPCAPCGAVAGIFARTDSTRGVWKAPAGLDATLLGVSGAEYTLTDAENSILNPLGINCIRAFSSAGRVLWGARTMHGADNQASEYKYIPVRRLALFIQESIFRGLQWVVFEPNGESLWRQIHLKTGAFMHNLYTMGAFRGTKPQEAYFIKCDKESTTQTDIDKGVVNVWVGFAPLRPAEFIIIQIQQSAGRKPGG